MQTLLDHRHGYRGHCNGTLWRGDCGFPGKSRGQFTAEEQRSVDGEFLTGSSWSRGGFWPEVRVVRDEGGQILRGALHKRLAELGALGSK